MKHCRQYVFRPLPKQALPGTHWQDTHTSPCAFPPAAAVAGPPGTAELARALHMLAPQAARHDAWRQGAHVMTVGDCSSEEEQLGYMRSLLNSVPQVSAPAGWWAITVLHPEGALPTFGHPPAFSLALAAS